MKQKDKNTEMSGESVSDLAASSEVQQRAMASLFDILETICTGAVSVDKHGKIAWINDKYRAFLDMGEDKVLLGEDVEKIIPESRLREVVDTGKPVLLDIMRFNDRYFVVSRLPLFDTNGSVIGAIGFVLYENLNYLKPMITKFELLTARLSKAEAQLASERRTHFNITNIIGEHPRMIDLRRQVRRVATRNCPVLILGETGTGKELLAHSIHALSHRANAPFVVVNMAAIPDALLEAEFFGVAPGAFTGAGRQAKEGKLSLANEGTLFMDEVADMPLNIQVKLLRALDEQTFEAVGSNDVRKVNIRIIAATSQDLEAKIEKGEFRQDLFFRLNVIPIQIPPLRDRVEDIRSIAEKFLKLIATDMGEEVREVTDTGFAHLMSYNWPGNIRELRNILERACFLTDERVMDEQVFTEMLPITSSSGSVLTSSGVIDKHEVPAELSLSEKITIVERQAIREALLVSGGKKTAAARKLGISRSTLYEKIEEYNLSDVHA